jgi:methionyl-tRNA synthetase
MAANLELPKRIFAHGWWTNEGSKISKSLGNVIDPINIISEYGLDQFRYFILREVPFGNDGDFSTKALINRINSDLSNDLGNLCQRSLSMIHKNLDGVIPEKTNKGSSEDELIKKSEKIIDESIILMNDQKIHEYIKLVWDLINDTNKYFNDQKPWELLKNDIKRFNTVLNTTCELIKRISIFIYPIMPDTSIKILNMLNVKIDILFSSINKQTLDNVKINPLSQLFPRID